MSETTFQYPPDLFALLVDTVPVLCKSKKDVVLFFRGAGAPANMTADLRLLEGLTNRRVGWQVIQVLEPSQHQKFRGFGLTTP